MSPVLMAAVLQSCHSWQVLLASLCHLALSFSHTLISGGMEFEKHVVQYFSVGLEIENQKILEQFSFALVIGIF